ncbi:hypothetical protein ABT160_23605 [Streptomyces sp. NPDC001941]|uniref:hypothetical protein n=1 Tax=Streptomyces sp. NPDC001941 TaxID=3154659 RepID=UPI0033169BAE
MRTKLIRTLGGYTRTEHRDALAEAGALDMPPYETATDRKARAAEELAALDRVRAEVPGFRDGIPSINHAVSV